MMKVGRQGRSTSLELDHVRVLEPPADRSAKRARRHTLKTGEAQSFSDPKLAESQQVLSGGAP